MRKFVVFSLLALPILAQEAPAPAASPSPITPVAAIVKPELSPAIRAYQIEFFARTFDGMAECHEEGKFTELAASAQNMLEIMKLMLNIFETQPVTDLPAQYQQYVAGHCEILQSTMASIAKLPSVENGELSLDALDECINLAKSNVDALTAKYPEPAAATDPFRFMGENDLMVIMMNLIEEEQKKAENKSKVSTDDVIMPPVLRRMSAEIRKLAP